MKPESPSGEARLANGVSERKGIRSAEIGMRVLDALSRARGPLPLKAVAAASGLSASQAHRYLASYLRCDMVVQDAATGRYDLGSMALRIGLAALNRIDGVDIAANTMKRLVSETDATGVVAVWSERGPVVVRWERASNVTVTSLTLGTIFTVLSSTTGRVFLAWLPERMTRPLVEAELRRALPSGERLEWADVRRIVAKTRAQGFAALSGHYIPGFRAVAAPVRDSRGEAVAAISLVAYEAGSESEAQIRRLVLQAASDASAQLGFDPEQAGGQGAS